MDGERGSGEVSTGGGECHGSIELVIFNRSDDARSKGSFGVDDGCGESHLEVV